MFQFYGKSGEVVFSDSNIQKVVDKALEYKLQNGLKSVEICNSLGRFVRWA